MIFNQPVLDLRRQRICLEKGSAGVPERWARRMHDPDGCKNDRPIRWQESRRASLKQAAQPEPAAQEVRWDELPIGFY